MIPICPYCRQPIDQEDVAGCPDCEIPHHLECWIENNGCTMVGCTQAPPDEPKMSVAGTQRSRPMGTAHTPRATVLQRTALPVPSPDSIPTARTTYMVLGLCLGAFGMHNFYAGYLLRGTAQLSITCLTLFYGAVIAWPWAVLEVLFVSADGRGRPMY